MHLIRPDEAYKNTEEYLMYDRHNKNYHTDNDFYDMMRLER